MNSAILRLLALAFVAGVSSLPARSQPAPRWELVGMAYENGTSPVGLDQLAIAEGSEPDLDTLYLGSYAGIWKRTPGPSSDITNKINGTEGERLIITSEGFIIGGSRAGVGGHGTRSADRGRTWQNNVITLPIRVNGVPSEQGCGVVALLQSTLPALGGAVYAGCGPEVWRSFQGGAYRTWAFVGEPGGELTELREMPPSAMLPEGRLVVGTQGRIATSDDGGATWTPRLDAPTIFQDLALAPDAAHPYGGVLYAGGREFGRGRDPLASVYASSDGGATWERRHAFVEGEFVTRPGAITLVVGPDGLLYGGLRYIIGGPDPDLGTVVRSRDGGVTWEQVAEGYGGWAVNAFAVGRDGRLYLVADRGLWRTVAPIAVAGEAEPGAARPLGVTVRPNPASGRVEVVLTLAEAADVRVVARDALGREVTVVLAGVVSGERVVGVDTASWPAGVYVVRATAAGSGGAQAATARLVVAR